MAFLLLLLIFFLGFLLLRTSLQYAFFFFFLAALGVKTAAMVLLIANGIFVGFLLLGQRFLCNRGFLEDSFISQFGDWRSTALRVLRVLIKIFIVWEAVVLIFCTVLWLCL